MKLKISHSPSKLFIIFVISNYYRKEILRVEYYRDTIVNLVKQMIVWALLHVVYEID